MALAMYTQDTLGPESAASKVCILNALRGEGCSGGSTVKAVGAEGCRNLRAPDMSHDNNSSCGLAVLSKLWTV
jgi:hypothetical protein